MAPCTACQHCYKSKAPLEHEEEGGEREMSEEDAACRARGRQGTLSADVNGVAVCHKAKRATECPQLVNKEMRVN